MNDETPAAASLSPEPDLTGCELGDYRLLRRLGRGGMAEVYLAEQLSLQRQIALKILRRNLVDDVSYVRRFHHEARAAAKLVHANIVQIYEVGCVDGVHFIAQEYVPGQNLKQIISRQGPLEVPAALLILRQVAAALHKSGQQSIVHRDIKPENILLGPEGEVKVADFGLARVISNGEVTSLTQVGVTMGTPLYMSPEQVEGKSLDGRSDLYSLGVTCYYMLTGRPPFDGESALAVAMQHVRNHPQRLEQLRPGLPEGLCRLVHRLLAKEPDQRFASAAELLAELRSLRVEGLDEGWFEDTGDWGAAELLALSTVNVRGDATQQLELYMREARALRPPRRLALWFGGGVLTAFLLGGLLAWNAQPASLLEPDPNAPPVEVARRDSVRAQYYYAAMNPSEATWQSVWKKFPPESSQENRYYMHLAQEQLGRLYYNNGQYDEAQAIFQELVDLPDTEKQFRASGLAGLAIVYSLRGEYAKSQEYIADARALLEELHREGLDREQDWRPAELNHFEKVDAQALGNAPALSP